jgi:hypothetical protein
MVSTRLPATDGNTSECMAVVARTLHSSAEIRGVDLADTLPRNHLGARQDAVWKSAASI